MDVSTNGLATGGYRGNVYGSGGGSGSSGAEGEQDRYVVGGSSRRISSGDSLLGSPLPRRTNTPTKANVDPKQALKAFQLARTISFSLAAVAAFVFGIMVLQPILLPLFTFGLCFAGGMAEWLEFSWTVLKISVIPAAIGTLCGWVGYFAHRKTKELSEKLDEVDQRAQPQLSPALMARLSSNRVV